MAVSLHPAPEVVRLYYIPEPIINLMLGSTMLAQLSQLKNALKNALTSGTVSVKEQQPEALGSVWHEMRYLRLYSLTIPSPLLFERPNLVFHLQQVQPS